MDEIEIEKLPLGSGPGDESPGGRPVTAASAPLQGSQSALRRRLGTIASLVAVLLVGILIATATPGSRDALRSVLHLPTPTATPTLPFGSDYVYFEHAVPWAQPPLLDGKPVPRNVVNSGPASFRIPARGRHSLDYDVAPFPPLHCRFTIPAARDDTCPLGQQAELGLPGTVKLARVLDLGGLPSRLPADQFAALDHAVRAVVDLPDATAQVLPGERYRTTDGIQVATEPLTATFSFGVRPDPTSTCDGSATCGQACSAICVMGAGMGKQGRWLVQVRADGSWRYTTRDGRVVADNVPAQPTDSGGFVQSETQDLYAHWASGWAIDAGPTNSITDPQQLLCRALYSLDVPRTGPEGSSYATVSVHNPAEGCLYIGLSPASIEASAAEELVLFRFGVLLAVDDATHRALPDLPFADAHERTIAQQTLAAFLTALKQQMSP